MADNQYNAVQGDVPSNLAGIVIAGENGYFGSQAVKYASQTKVNPANSAILLIGVVAIVGIVLYMRK